VILERATSVAPNSCQKVVPRSSTGAQQTVNNNYENGIARGSPDSGSIANLDERSRSARLLTRSACRESLLASCAVFPSSYIDIIVALVSSEIVPCKWER
jgi:hypothetical protein